MMMNSSQCAKTARRIDTLNETTKEATKGALWLFVGVLLGMAHNGAVLPNILKAAVVVGLLLYAALVLLCLYSAYYWDLHVRMMNEEYWRR